MSTYNIVLRLFGMKEPADRISELEKEIKQKNSHIKTLENMIESNEKRHVEDMKNVSEKLDYITTIYQKQREEIRDLKNDLKWSIEEAAAWRERLELKISGPSDLAELERLRTKPTNDK